MPKRGETASPETRARMAAARKAWWQTADPEIIQGLLDKQRGQKRPKTSEALKGKRKARNWPLTGRVIICDREGCDQTRYLNPYELAKSEKHYCSRLCAWTSRIAEQQKNPHWEMCQYCGKEFLRSPRRGRYKHGHHYCSRPCADEGRRGANHPAWAGGRQQRPDGYVDLRGSVLVPETYHSMLRKDGRVMEHRIVMALSLGRPLEIWEVVHHKDGVRNHNVLENLELHSAHGHNGITASENREIARLKSDMKRLQAKLDQLERIKADP